jgi:hypothetical protein
MTAPLDLRKHYCRQCDYSGWLLFDEDNERLQYTREITYVTKEGHRIDTELIYSYAKPCRCLLNIRAGDYN